jgi:hypothetical protein
LNVHAANGIMQTEISTAEPLLPEPSSAGIKITSFVFFNNPYEKVDWS